MTTKTKAPADTALATMLAVELHRVLSDASVFASHDETIPPICAVHIEIGPKRMLAVATDRFRLVVSKTDLQAGGFGSEAVFNLSLRDVVSLIKMSKTTRSDAGSKTVWINSALPPSDEYGTGTVEFKFSDGATLKVVPQDSEFPKWRQLFPGTDSQVARAFSAFNPKYLADFAKVQGFPIRMYSHGEANTRPSTFTIGENFVGLLMPYRTEGRDTWVKPEWMA